MVYQAKYNKGFSLIELLVVISVFLLLLFTSNTLYVSSKSYNDLAITTDSMVEALRHAKANSEKSLNDSSWGVSIFPSQLVIFEGQNYLSRDIGSDQPLNFPSEVIISGLSEVVFDKLTGWTSNIGTTTIKKGEKVKNILINAKGTITY